MKELRTEVTIDAPAELVWELLTDFDSFADWNPFMQRASGNLAVEEKLVIYLKPPGGMGMSFKPRILKVVPNREFRWLGHFVMPGVFDGEHIFEIDPIGDASCRFVQREEFRGILALPILAMIGKSTERGFTEMNQALKARAENAAPR